MGRWFLLLLVLPYNNSLEVGNITEPCACCNRCRFKTQFLIDQDRPCYCENENCWMYDDCCFNATPKRDLVRNAKRSCELIDSYRKKSYYVVNSCPTDWLDENIRSLCAKDVEEYNYALDLPFQSKDTEILYSNLYCAVCNGDYTSINGLKIEFVCEIENCTTEMIDQLIYKPGNLTWIHPISKKKFEINISGKDLKGCDRKVVEKCADDWEDEEVSLKCKAYTSYVVKTWKIVMYYQNIYCAICNYENATELDCLVNECCKAEYDSDMDSDVIPGISFPPLSHLINEHEKCPGDFISLDSETCVPFLCGKNYKPENGNCVPVNVSQNVTQLSCPGTLISIDELTIFPNGSIYRNDTNTFYEINEYEFVNETFYLVCISLPPRSDSLHPSEIISMICVVISLISLLCHVTIQFVIGNYQKLADKNLLNMSLSLFLVYFVSLITNFVKITKSVCYSFSAFTLYCFLVYFFSVNVMAFDICRTITKSERKTNSIKTFIRYMIYSWITPLIIVILAVVVDESDVLPDLMPYKGTVKCFMDSTMIMLVFFFLPFAILLIENIVFFSLTAHAIRKTAKLTKRMTKSHESKQLCLYIKLAFVMGGMWVFSLINMFFEITILSYIYVILNDSQGTIVFLFFTVKKSVWKKLYKRKKVVSVSGKETLSTDAFSHEKTTNS